jgi:hypothetical protein
MQLARSSRLYRWATWAPWFEDHYEKQYDLATETSYRRTSLCYFFWQCFVFATFSNIVVAAFVAAVAPFAFCIGIYRKRRQAVLDAMTTQQRLAYYRSRQERELAKEARIRRVLARIHGSFFVQGLLTIKGKVCPIIDIE